MEIWLKQDKKSFRLPILPSEFGESESQNNTTENVNAIGEVNLLGLKNLGEITISAHFPKRKMYYDQYSTYPAPDKCVNLIRNMMKKGVIRLVQVNPSLINIEATIESFEWKEQDATGDIYYTITIKEYNRPSKKRSTKTPNSATGAKIVTVKKGDTWATISKKNTGSSKNAKKIQKANKMTNKKTPPVGKKIQIPKI